MTAKKQPEKKTTKTATTSKSKKKPGAAKVKPKQVKIPAELEMFSDELDELVKEYAKVGMVTEGELEDDLNDSKLTKKQHKAVAKYLSAVGIVLTSDDDDEAAAISLDDEDDSGEVKILSDKEILEDLDEEDLSTDMPIEAILPKNTTNKRGRRKRVVDLSSTLLTQDPVRMYLKEIGKIPLLKQSEEIDLAVKIEAGVKATTEIEELEEAREDAGGQESQDDRRKMRRLKRIEQVGFDAKDQLVAANLRLVVSIAKRYRGRGLPLLDLVQEGNLGLIRAVEKFEYKKGFKFSTYATWWIRQAITRAIAVQARTIRIPVHMIESINRMNKTSRLLMQELGRDPTPEELAQEMDLPIERVREMQKISQDPISLEKPIGEEDDSELGDFIEDSKIAAPPDVANNVLLKEQINRVLDTMTERERKVIELRFGLVDGHPRTLEDVGRAFNITRERIRQIEGKTLAKLRHPSRSAKLRDYLEV